MVPFVNGNLVQTFGYNVFLLIRAIFLDRADFLSSHPGFAVVTMLHDIKAREQQGDYVSLSPPPPRMESKEDSFVVMKKRLLGVIFALSREGGQLGGGGGDVLLLRVTSPSGGNEANCGGGSEDEAATRSAVSPSL